MRTTHYPQLQRLRAVAPDNSRTPLIMPCFTMYLIVAKREREREKTFFFKIRVFPGPFLIALA